MKVIEKLLLLVLIMISFSNCSSSYILQTESPIQLGKVYCQSWVAGVQGGGSGLNLYIPVKEKWQSNISLDSVYFRGRVTKLEQKSGDYLIFVGRFLSDTNSKNDVIMSKEPYAEYGNKLPKKVTKIPFDLENSECVVSYKEGKATKYFKIKQITQKELLAYPSAPPQNKQ
ncbi:MAG: hypothetical protein HKO92_07255 [Flavobacteriaceae bacterium]|nr:hypothetical protein [Flavobacteriaceae bacterium]